MDLRLGPWARDWLDLSSWHVKPAGRRDLFAGLDGIRGVAILMVVACHTMPFVFWSIGTEGVWLFFVLSGFLITLPFFQRLAEGRPGYPARYGWRRGAKIVPPYALSVFCTTLLLVMATGSAAPWRGGVETLLFFNIFVTPNPPISSIYWSLAAEVSFYAAVPVLFLAGRALLRGRAWMVPVFFLAVATVTWLLVAGAVVPPGPLVRDVLLSFGFFGWGSLFAWRRTAFGGAAAAMAAQALALGATLFLICTGWKMAADQLWGGDVLKGFWSRLAMMNLVGGAGFLMLFVVDHARSYAGRVLSWPLLVLAGEVSYEWYLFHLVFIGISDHTGWATAHGRVARLLAHVFFGFPVAFVFAAVLYRMFSLPILRRAHRRSG